MVGPNSGRRMLAQSPLRPLWFHDQLNENQLRDRHLQDLDGNFVDSVRIGQAALVLSSYGLGAIMNVKTSNYGAARGILGLAEIGLWGGVGLGVIVAISAAGAASRGFGSPGLLAALPGIFISMICFLGVVLVQMAKATVDTADYSYQMLSVARDQLAVSKQALSKPNAASTYASQVPKAQSDRVLTRGAGSKVNSNGPASSGVLEAQQPQPNSAQRKLDYRGKRINRTVHGYLVEGHNFETLELAKLHVDGDTR